MICAIAGGTGLVGTRLITELLSDPRATRILALGRRTAAGQPSVAPKLARITVDFEDPATFPTGETVDAAFCCLGTTLRKAGSREAFRRVDFEYALRFAEWAKKNGATRFLVVTAVGAAPSSHFFYNRVKGELEAALHALSFTSLVILRPSFLLGEREERRAAEALGIRVFTMLRPLLVGPLRDAAPVDAARVAGAMAERGLGPLSPGTVIVTNREMQ